ncbi:CT620/CT621 family type III secretion system effector [Chlamydia vaughanii]|uniref:CT620/CT621 family type III secretion system effector n=1 Tax=Chlamydia vaughanii TaxID=3112552 RepID=UPI0032B2BFD4
MTIQPTYLTFSRNITSALLGNQIDTTTPVSNAVFLFQELDLKAKGLKHSLGLLQEVESQIAALPVAAELPEDLFLEGSPESRINIVATPPTADEIKEIITNPHLASAKRYIEGLEKNFEDWLKPVDQGGLFDPTPAEEALVKEYQTRLNTLKTVFTSGTPGDEQYNTLYALPRDFVAAIDKLEGKDAPPKSKVINFWQNMMVIYHSMATVLYPATDDINIQLSQIALNIEDANNIIGLIRQFASTFKDFCTPYWNLEPGAVSLATGFYDPIEASAARNYIMLGDLYRMLMSRYPTDVPDALPAQIKSGIDIFLNSLNNIQVAEQADGTHNPFYLNDFMGMLYCYEACATQYMKFMATSNDEYKRVLEQAKTYWQQRSNAKFNVAGSPFDTYINNPAAAYNRYVYLFADEGAASVRPVPNPLFFQRAVEVIAENVDPKPLTRNQFQTIITGVNKSIEAIQNQIDVWNVESTKLMSSKSNLDISKLNYFAAMNADKKQFVDTSPLQMVYSSLMLDKYLPNQQRVLEMLGEQMTFSNKAARFMNELITFITSFQNSDVYYSLAIYLRQMNLQELPDAIGKARNVFAKEEKRTTTDFKRCKRARDKIGELLPKIESDAELTSSQKRELRQKLRTYDLQLELLSRNLSYLYCFLDKVELKFVEKPNEVDEAFDLYVNNKKSTGFERILAFLESFVIEGGENGIVPGGEQQVLQGLESTQQDYTTFNQNQQLALQLETSAIQQEWTMVSAALALMNQIFAKITRRIK